jgi:hypothetical protein
MFEMKKNVDRPGPRPLLDNPHIADSPCFFIVHLKGIPLSKKMGCPKTLPLALNTQGSTENGAITNTMNMQ